MNWLVIFKVAINRAPIVIKFALYTQGLITKRSRNGQIKAGSGIGRSKKKLK